MTTYKSIVVDQTTYNTFIEYVVRFINTEDDSDLFEKRFQADGTLLDLQTKVTDYLNSLNIIPPSSEVVNGSEIGNPEVINNSTNEILSRN